MESQNRLCTRYTGFSSQGRAKLRAFPHHCTAKNTQLIPSLHRKPCRPFPSKVWQPLAHQLHIGLEVEHEAHGAPGLVGRHGAGAGHQIGPANLSAEASSEASHPREAWKLHCSVSNYLIRKCSISGIETFENKSWLWSHGCQMAIARF